MGKRHIIISRRSERSDPQKPSDEGKEKKNKDSIYSRPPDPYMTVNSVNGSDHQIETKGQRARNEERARNKDLLAMAYNLEWLWILYIIFLF